MVKPGRMFRHVNPALAESLARDFKLRLGGTNTRELRAGMSSPVVLEHKRSRTSEGPKFTDPKTLDQIVSKLRKSGQLRDARPARPNDYWMEELERFEWPVQSNISGISSLRLAVEVIGADKTWAEVQGLPPIDDRFSERVEADPLSKLESVGGLVGTPRRITTVYKIAYMNDEQGWFFGERFLRTNDILAYPLYIELD